MLLICPWLLDNCYDSTRMFNSTTTFWNNVLLRIRRDDRKENKSVNVLRKAVISLVLLLNIPTFTIKRGCAQQIFTFLNDFTFGLGSSPFPTVWTRSQSSIPLSDTLTFSIRQCLQNRSKGILDPVAVIKSSWQAEQSRNIQYRLESLCSTSNSIDLHPSLNVLCSICNPHKPTD